jgi:hypothetical protein
VPPIKPVSATPQAIESAPFTAPPETAFGVGRKISNHAVRNRADRLMNKTGYVCHCFYVAILFCFAVDTDSEWFKL